MSKINDIIEEFKRAIKGVEEKNLLFIQMQKQV